MPPSIRKVGAMDNRLYHLYRMDGPDLDRLNQPVAIHAASAGLVFDLGVFPKIDFAVVLERMSDTLAVGPYLKETV
jgi:hypothetical protein